MLRTVLPLLAFAPFTAFAQPQLNNPSFENWQNLGSGTEEPTEWSSIKTSDGGSLINSVAPQVCFRSADFHTGTYSVNVRSLQAPGVVANGTATCGRVHATFTPSEGSVFTDAGNTDWNHALTSKPDSLVGWFKATPQGNDNGKVEAILHTGAGSLPANGTTPNWNARARWIAPEATVSSWTRFSVPFTYFNATTPAYILMVLTSGDSLVTVLNSQSWYDDIALIYNVTASPSIPSATVNGTDPVLFNVNYATGGLPTSSTLFTVQLSEPNGSFTNATTLGFIASTAATGTIACTLPGNTTPGAGYKIRMSTPSAFYAPVAVPFSINSNAVVRVAMKAFLDGPYVSGTQLMNDGLRNLGIIPPTEPYTGLSYPHVGGGGETVAPAVLAVTGNNAVVDWVVVELRDKNNSANVVRTRSALIQRDGDVVDVDGVSNVPFTMGADNYFVAVRHRNHLSCMTLLSVPISATSALIDLTLASTNTFGTNARKVNGARTTLWPGNAKRDLLVKYAGSNNDRDPILTAIGGSVPTATASGYRPEDLNLDGTTKYAGGANDRDLILQTIGGSVPTATKTDQLP